MKRGLIVIFGAAAVLAFLALLYFYFFSPVRIEFFSGNMNSNFSISNSLYGMQFYPNMRFLSSDISYRISSDCPNDKADEMKDAFSMLANLTVLKFYPVNDNEEISVACSNEVKPQNDGMFIAGEGGPTKVIAGDKFNIIFSGKILLLNPPSCPLPNVALHELLHVLGFQHSENPKNIMYNITNCIQTLGADAPMLINNLYSYPSIPDLEFGNSSAYLHGRYLNLNITVMNYGLADAEPASVEIYAGKTMIKKFDTDLIKAGEGEIITFANIFVSQIDVDKIILNINYNGDELQKDNNEIMLEMKNESV